MSQKHGTCFGAEHLTEFLYERLSETEESSVLLHLDDCVECQRTLESVAGDGSVWSDVKEQYNHSLDDTSDLNEDSPRTQILNSVKDFLGPTDDPNMMGRLGAYEVSGVVGRGSTGIVVKAFESRLNRFVAIKVLSPNFASNGSARVRFEREARAIAAVAHEHVVPIFAVDEYKDLPYLVMQYAGGGSLQQRIDREGPLEPCEIVRIGMQVASGLAAAHEQGIVHRDVKPANVMLESGVERAMVTDFGLALVANDASLTRSGVITGTPQFMSPEQAKGEYVDHRSDLFSLGSLMYTASTGRPPFRSETVYGVIRRVCESEIRPIREINPGIPVWLEAFIAKLCLKDREERFQTAVEVRDRLSQELAHLQSPVAMPPPNRSWMPRKEGKKKSPGISRRIIRNAALVILAATVFAVMRIPPVRSTLFGDTNPAAKNDPTAFVARPVYEVFESTITRALPVKKNSRLKFAVGFADVKVLPSECDQLDIRVTRKVSAIHRKRADELFALHRLDFELDESGLAVETMVADCSPQDLMRFGEFEIRIFAPAGFDINIARLEDWQETDSGNGNHQEREWTKFPVDKGDDVSCKNLATEQSYCCAANW